MKISDTRFINFLIKCLYNLKLKINKYFPEAKIEKMEKGKVVYFYYNAEAEERARKLKRKIERPTKKDFEDVRK